MTFKVIIGHNSRTDCIRKSVKTSADNGKPIFWGISFVRLTSLWRVFSGKPVVRVAKKLRCFYLINSRGTEVTHVRYLNSRGAKTTYVSHLNNREAETTYQARNRGGAFGAFAPPEIFKILHGNFDICRNFQRIKKKFYILSIFKKSYCNFSLSYW